MNRRPTVFTFEQEPVAERPRGAPSSNTAAKPAAIRPVAWDLKRDPPRPHDLRLSPHAARWMAELPAPVRPASLAERFPRIANRLAISWQDATLAGLLLEQLLSDRRGGRTGFPPEVRLELTRLAADVKTRKAMPAAA